MKKVSTQVLLVVAFVVVLMSCKTEPGWEITLSGKVGFPQQG